MNITENVYYRYRVWITFGHGTHDRAAGRVGLTDPCEASRWRNNTNNHLRKSGLIKATGLRLTFVRSICIRNIEMHGNFTNLLKNINDIGWASTNACDAVVSIENQDMDGCFRLTNYIPLSGTKTIHIPTERKLPVAYLFLSLIYYCCIYTCTQTRVYVLCIYVVCVYYHVVARV